MPIRFWLAYSINLFFYGKLHFCLFLENSRNSHLFSNYFIASQIIMLITAPVSLLILAILLYSRVLKSFFYITSRVRSFASESQVRNPG